MGVHVLSPFDERVTVTCSDGTPLTATALPDEPDTPQLLAAEQVGLFTYPNAADSDSMKGHAA